ncbi:IDEAL domain-containing protein [Aneurinibacillus sp. REN35]|uniref:IDEAL domain-containing protein n=1 Tax=Aneurinibacillus sp. REN35 TaxID=3237286 RepID=UPI003527C3F8
MEKQKQSIVNPSTLSLMAEMVLDEAIRNYRIDTLYKHIDEALIQGDKAKFKSLSGELKKVLASKESK